MLPELRGLFLCLSLPTKGRVDLISFKIQLNRETALLQLFQINIFSPVLGAGSSKLPLIYNLHYNSHKTLFIKRSCNIHLIKKDAKNPVQTNQTFRTDNNHNEAMPTVSNIRLLLRNNKELNI